MRTEEEFRAALMTWIGTRVDGIDLDQLSERTPLFAGGHLTSLHVPELILLIERLREAPIDVEGLQSGDFYDVSTILDRFFVCEDFA